MIRRRLHRALAGAGLVVLAGLAGCGGGSGTSAPAGAEGGAVPVPPAAASAPVAASAPAAVRRPAILEAYDPGDPDRVLALPLTRPLATAELAPLGDGGRARVELVGPARFDPVAGLTLGTGARLRLHDIDGLARLAGGWQLYVEVERRALAVLPSMAASAGGSALQTEQALLAWRASAGADNREAIVATVSTAKDIVLAVGDGRAVGSATMGFHDAVLAPGRSHVPLLLWSDGRDAGLWIDAVGGPPVALDPARLLTGLLELGAAPQSALRHLLLVARAPRRERHPTLQRMAVFGDSYAQFSADHLHSRSYSASPYLQAQAELARAGWRIDWSGDATRQAYPGHLLMGHARSPVPIHLGEPRSAAGNHLWDRKEAMLAAHAPQLLVVQSGSNDLPIDGVGFDAARWKGWVLEWCRWALGEGGYPRHSVQRLVFATTPHSPQVGADEAARAARRAQAQAMQEATLEAVADFRRLYPARAPDVEVADLNTAFAQSESPEALFSAPGSSDAGGHPSLLGDVIKGRTWGRAAARLLAR